MAAAPKLTSREVEDLAPPGWVLLVDGLQTRIDVDDLASGAALVSRIGAAARERGHGPVLTLRSDAVDVRLTTPEVHGVTADDVVLAETITRLAEESGLTTASTAVTRLELALDTPDLEAVSPFWAAVLGAEQRSGPDFGNEVRDATDTLPTVWFQRSGSTEPRQHWHLDVWIDPAEVPARINAARAAGGELVSDAEAPAFWVLADPQGNKVCLCTWQSRD